MDWNRFQRELQQRNIVSDHPQVAYMLAVVFEQMVDMSKQLDMCASVCESMANTVANMGMLNAKTMEELRALKKEMHKGVDGVTITSEQVN